MILKSYQHSFHNSSKTKVPYGLYAVESPIDVSGNLTRNFKIDYISFEARRLVHPRKSQRIWELDPTSRPLPIAVRIQRYLRGESFEMRHGYF